MAAAVSPSGVRFVLVLVACAALVAAGSLPAPAAEMIAISCRFMEVMPRAGQPLGPAEGESWGSYLAALLQEGRAQMINEPRVSNMEGRPVQVYFEDEHLGPPGVDGAAPQRVKALTSLRIIPRRAGEGSLNLDLRVRTEDSGGPAFRANVETEGLTRAIVARVRLTVPEGEPVVLRGLLAPWVMRDTQGTVHPEVERLVILEAKVVRYHYTPEGWVEE